MAILDALRSFFTLPPSFLPFDEPTPFIEERGLTFSQMWNTGLDELNGTVTTDSARRVMAVYACWSLISGDLASLPFDAFRKLRPSGSEEIDPQPDWLTGPNPSNPNMTRNSYMRQVALSLLQDGNAFIVANPSVFNPRQLLVLNPAQVQIRDGDSDPAYVVTSTSGKETLGVLTPADLIHIPFLLPPGATRGLNPIEAASQAIGLSLSSEDQASKFYQGGGLVTGIIEVPAEAGPMTQEQMDAMREGFKRRREGPTGYSIGILQGGATFKPVTLSSEDAQTIETRKLSLEEIARLYLVPPFMIGSQEPAGVAYASSVERAQFYIDHCLSHYAVLIEKGHDRLLPGRDTFVKFNFNGFLKGDPKSRWDTYRVQLETKAASIEEVRGREDWTPKPEGTLLETPNNSGVQRPAEPAPQRDAVQFNLSADTVRAEVPEQPAPIVNVEASPAPDFGPLVDVMERIAAREQPAPIVHVEAPPAPVVQMDLTELRALIASVAPRAIRKTVIRDDAGKIIGSIEEPV